MFYTRSLSSKFNIVVRRQAISKIGLCIYKIRFGILYDHYERSFSLQYLSKLWPVASLPISALEFDFRIGYLENLLSSLYHFNWMCVFLGDGCPVTK